MTRCFLVIGASGDVGRGISAELLRNGCRVVAAGRKAEQLAQLQTQLAAVGALETVVGSVEDAAQAAVLRDKVLAAVGRLDGVIVSVNAPLRPAPLHELDGTQLLELLRTNVLSHFAAACTFCPALQDGATYLGIGGGMADLVVPGFGAVSMCQAAQRAMYRALEAEMPQRGIRIRELMIYSMVAGESNRATAHPKWITDDEVGRHVWAILSQPDVFAETILTLKSRKQVGLPQATQA